MLLSSSEYYIQDDTTECPVCRSLVLGWQEYKPTHSRKCCTCFYMNILNEFIEDIKKKSTDLTAKKEHLCPLLSFFMLCSSMNFSLTIGATAQGHSALLGTELMLPGFPDDTFHDPYSWLFPYLFHCDLIWQCVILILTLTKRWLLKTCLVFQHSAVYLIKPKVRTQFRRQGQLCYNS